MNLRPFEIVLIAIFGVLAVGGVVFVTFFQAQKGVNPYGTEIMIWGALPRTPMNDLLQALADTDQNLSVVRYEEKDPRTLTRDLLNAVAAGESPDLVIIPHRDLVSYESFIAPISSLEFPIADFRTTYSDGSEIFLSEDGVLGLPLFVDPLVMYWNRDLIATAGIAVPPQTWEMMLSEAIPLLTRKADPLTITQSAVGLGGFDNIRYAEEILATLFFQAGSPLVSRERNGYRIALSTKAESGLPAGEAVLPFYTQFVNPQSQYYTWNQSLPEDEAHFIGGRLGLYFAPASRRVEIERQNPNLNFDVTTVPQGAGVTVRRVSGEFYGLVRLKASNNQAGAVAVARLLGDSANVSRLLTDYPYAPVHRTLLTRQPADNWGRSAYASALIARGWYNPNPTETRTVLRTMVGDVIAGRAKAGEAIQDASSRLQALFSR
jgi:ABC-type glycerol-3-phosphate transport system substrate-binding protein